MSFMSRFVRRRQSEEPIAKRKNPEQEEAYALEIFQDRLAYQRSSIVPKGGYPVLRAPGFDYVNWKPYGVIRYDSGPNDYERQCHALAPYVHSVLVSGCEGSEERRWEALTTPVDTNSRPLGSRAGSKDILGSRAASRDMM